MPNQPKTPNRVIRVDDKLWADYGQACAAKGTTRSDDLRAHMVNEVEKTEQADFQVEGANSGGRPISDSASVTVAPSA